MKDGVWIEVCLTAAEAVAEQVADEVRPFAEGGAVALEQWGDPADLAPHALLPEVYVKLYLNSMAHTPEIRQKLGAIAAAYQCPPPTFTVLDNTDWANAWKENYRPFQIAERFWIQPSWEPAAEARPDDIVITLDPGMAFGTGLHATTQLCFELLTRHLRPGMSLLDVGCGSGILSMAAAKLGAQTVLAVDTDEAAVEATLANAALNQISNIEVLHGSLDVVPSREWDIVVVNILAAIMMPMLDEAQLLSYAAPEGVFVFSGVVEEQAELFTGAVKQAGGEVLETTQQDGWVALTAQQK